jgi:NH3-dependent NAD+ synthetase
MPVGMRQAEEQHFTLKELSLDLKKNSSEILLSPPFMPSPPEHCVYKKTVYPDGVYIDTVICYHICERVCDTFIKWYKEEKARITSIKKKNKEREMASRAELIQMCEELEIEYEDMSIDEMAKAVREEADRRFNVKEKVSADDLSDTLKKFLIEEFDYVIRDKEGQELDWQGSVKEIRRAERKTKPKTKKKRAKKNVKKATA